MTLTLTCLACQHDLHFADHVVPCGEWNGEPQIFLLIFFKRKKPNNVTCFIGGGGGGGHISRPSNVDCTD